MTFAPQSLINLAEYWTAHGGVNLGIIGDTDHATRGVSYHLGKDQLRPDAYSIQTTRDRLGLTDAASAIDLGKLNGTYKALRLFSDWLARRCLSGTDDTNDIREVIYSPDGIHVFGFKDGVGFLIPDYGDASHTGHTHISWYRDSEFRDKVALFKVYFEEGTMPTFAWDGNTGRLGHWKANGTGHSYLRLKDGTLHPLPSQWVTNGGRAMGPIVMETGTILGDTLIRRTGYLIPAEAAFVLGVDGTFTSDPNTDAARAAGFAAAKGKAMVIADNANDAIGAITDG